MVIYNGLPQQCFENMPNFTLKYMPDGILDGPDIHNIEFKFENGSFISELNIDDGGKWKVEAFEIACNDGKKVKFDEMEIEPLEHEEEATPNMNLLVTYDLRNDDPKEYKGIINVGKYHGPFKQTNNAMPDIK